MLEVAGIETFYGASQALFGVDLEVGAGEVVTLMGRNGMGKTTTLHSIMGLTPIGAGRILVEGQAVDRWPAYRIARTGLALVPEGRQVFPNLTVWENLVATAARRDGRESVWSVDRIFEMFPELAERRTSFGSVLSGGEQQMLAIGRALMTNPRLLVLDEATEGLAPLIRARIWACLEELKASGQAILLVDKNVEDLTRIADRHYIIEKGRIVWNGESEGLRAESTLLDRYLGV